MFHVLSMGHFERGALAQRLIRVIEPLNMNVVERLLHQLGEETQPGRFTLGGFPVHFRSGYVECVYLAIDEVPEALEFARQLHDETRCTVADVRKNEIIYQSTNVDA